MANNYDQIITKTLTKISETGEVNASDILVLKFCTKEKKREAAVSPLKKILGGMTDTIGTIRMLFGGEE